MHLRSCVGEFILSHERHALDRRADIAFTRVRLAVFSHSCSWCSCGTQCRTPQTNGDCRSDTVAVAEDSLDALLNAECVWEHEKPTHGAEKPSIEISKESSESASPPSSDCSRLSTNWWSPICVTLFILQSIQLSEPSITGEPSEDACQAKFEKRLYLLACFENTKSNLL